MIKLDPSDRQPFSQDPQFPTLKIIFGLTAVLACVLFYWWYFVQGSRFSDVYRQIGISPLPVTLERRPEIQTRLDQLKRGPCYRDAIIALAGALLEAGYPQDADISLQTFAKRCGDSDEILVLRYDALSQASDFPAAFRIVDALVKTDPADAQVRYWRGVTYEKLKDFEHALTDYISSVQLLGDPDRVSINNFYDISRMYAALGRYCNAITPMETYISFDPANRRTTQNTKLISEFADKGNCDAKYARGSARIPRLPLPGMIGGNTLAVSVNGVIGNFLLDTGATYVAVTPDYASKVKLRIESGTQIPMKTVGGIAFADLGYATTVNVERAEAEGVSIVVIRGAANPFGARLDGLLGMSFLSRFKVNLSQDAIELTAIPLR